MRIRLAALAIVVICAAAVAVPARPTGTPSQMMASLGPGSGVHGPATHSRAMGEAPWGLIPPSATADPGMPPATRRASGADVVAPPPSVMHCQEPTGPDDFQRVAPESVGLDGAALQNAIDTATIGRNTLSIRVFRHGCLAATSRLDPLTADLPNQWMSATKTVSAMLVGRAIQLGRLGIDDPVSKWIASADPAHGRITVHDILTQSSGLRWSSAGDTWGPVADEVQQALHDEVLHPPGTYFEYAQHPLTLLLNIVQRAVGEDVQDFAQQQLFGPLGIRRSDWFWARDRSGNTTGWWGLDISARLMSRLGDSMLRGGTCGGRRLLPEWYVDEVGSSNAVNGGYGFLTWTNQGERYITADVPGRRGIEHPLVPSAPRDFYEFAGLGGQFVAVIPSLDMVIVRTGQTPERSTDVQTVIGGAIAGDWEWEFYRNLRAAVKDAGWQDPGPYRDNDPSPVDVEALVDARQVLDEYGMGPQAGNCNAIGCNGQLASSGDQTLTKDVLVYMTARL